MRISVEKTVYYKRFRITKFKIVDQVMLCVTRYKWHELWGLGYYNPKIFENTVEVKEYINGYGLTS